MNKKQMLLKLSMIFIMLLACANLFAGWQSDNGDGNFKNPPLYADYPDPSIIRVGSDFYLASTTFANVPGLVILHSQDLVNWEIISHCISSFPSGGAYDMIGGLKYANGCFAPSIAYLNGTFHVVVTLNGESTRIYHATNPAGPWTYTQLSSGYFDPCIFIESNGTPYLAWGGAWENAIKMIQLNSTLTGTTGSQQTILSYTGVEGTHMTKYGSYYYIFNSVPGSLSMACSRSTNLWGPYGETTTLCSDGNSGAHQGGIVDLPDGSYWGYAMKDSGAIGRMSYICPITWSNNWPVFGSSGKIASSYTKPVSNKPVMVPVTSDEFNGSTLGLQWMWNHNPDNTKWSFTGSALRLHATTGADFWHARNSLTQKGQGLTSSGSIRIDTSAIQSGDICGLGILGDPRGYIAVTTSPKRIIMSQEDSVQATVSNITATILYLLVEMNFSANQAKFFWHDDSTTAWQQLGTTITMGFDWQNGTFQGEQYAILCFNAGSSSGYMDVDWFRFDDKPGPGGDETPAPTAVPTAVPTIGPTPVPGTVSIACGSSSAVGSFQPDQYYSGGTAYNNTNTVDVSQITSNPPPAALFNNERYGAMSYTIPGFTSGSSYAVTLYFAETYLTSSGSRVFNVSINGTTALASFDIYASAGGQNKGIARSFATTADSSGQILIQLTAVTENPKINGIGINPGGGTRGDVNESGTIDIVDALLVAQAYVGLNPSNYNAAYADVNCSGEVDIVDALLIAQLYVGLISGFPC